MNVKDAQQLMLGVARDYERLAQRAKQRAQRWPLRNVPQSDRMRKPSKLP
jgi:hypothetical protein